MAVEIEGMIIVLMMMMMMMIVMMMMMIPMELLHFGPGLS